MRYLVSFVIQLCVLICLIYLLTFTSLLWKLIGLIFQFLVHFAHLVIVEGDTETKVFYAGMVVFLYGLARMRK